MALNFDRVDIRRHPMSASILSLIGLTAGLVLGSIAFRTPDSALRQLAPILEPIGQIWLNALLMISLPVVVSLLVTTIVGTGKSRQAGRLSGYTFLWFVVLLLATGIGTVAAGSALVKWAPLDEATRAAAQASISSGASAAAVPKGPTGSLKDVLVNLIPTNVIRAFANGDTLPVVIAALLFGIAIRNIGDEHREFLHKLFAALSATTLSLARYVLRLLPIAVFALTFTASSKAGAVLAGGVAYYVAAVIALLIAATVLLYPLTSWLGRASLVQFAKGVFPCQVVAITTRSSIASLPSLLDRGTAAVGVPGPVAAFVLPLSTSVFKLNRTISSPLKVIIISHLYGIPIDSGVKISFVLIATLLSFGSPGLPSGGSLVTLPFYLAAGLPIQGIILLDAVDSVPDIFKTLLNVTADMSVATIVARFIGTPVSAPARATEAAFEQQL